MLGKRIQRARKALGLSLRALAEEISLSHAAIKKYEDNKVTPSSDILLKLAHALHVKVEYFFRPETPVLENIQYRRHVDMPKRHLKEIDSRIHDQIERRFELESFFPRSPIQDFSKCELTKKVQNYNVIEKLADKVREQWDLGLDPIPDLIDVFEERGIKVFIIDNKKFPKFDGLYATINNMPLIVVANQRPGDRQRFTLAHELGHCLLDGFISEDLNLEDCCNRFAGAFLLPKKSLIHILGKCRNYIEFRELSLLKSEFGISMTSILHRAEETGIITSALYKKLRSEFDEKGWSKKEPGDQYPQDETHIFEQMVFHALAEDYIGESKAAELMNIPLESFRSLRAM